MKILKIVLLFTLVTGLYSCMKETSVELSNARGTLKSDGFDDCLPILVKGTYKKDSVLRDTNYVDITVDVTETGSYFIRTDTLNGFSFSATGAFSDFGEQTVRLKGLGKPIAPGLNTFKVRFEEDTCTFDIVVSGVVTVPPPTSTACGNTSLDYVLATIGGNCTLLNTLTNADYGPAPTPGFFSLRIEGENLAGDSSFSMSLTIPGTSIPTGSYDVNTAGYNLGAFFFGPTDDHLAFTGATANPTPVFTLTITSLTATRVKGTFTGALDPVPPATGVLQITAGEFDLPL